MVVLRNFNRKCYRKALSSNLLNCWSQFLVHFMRMHISTMVVNRFKPNWSKLHLYTLNKWGPITYSQIFKSLCKSIRLFSPTFRSANLPNECWVRLNRPATLSKVLKKVESFLSGSRIKFEFDQTFSQLPFDFPF